MKEHKGMSGKDPKATDPKGMKDSKDKEKEKGKVSPLAGKPAPASPTKR